VINRRHNAHYIAQKNGKLTRQDLLQEFGSGVYDLYVKDVNKKLLYHQQVPLHNRQFPPRVNPAELVVGDPVNEVYLEAWKKAVDGDKPDRGPVVRDDIAEIIRAAREGNKLEPHIIEWIQDFANHRDDLAAKLAEASAKNQGFNYDALASAIKTSLPPPAPATDPLAIVDKVLSIQNRGETDIDKLWKLVERVQGKPQSDSKASPLSNVKETLDLFGQVRELIQPETPAASAPVVTNDMSGWQAVTSSFFQSLPATLSSAAAFITAIKTGGGSAPHVNVPPAAARPVAFDPYRDWAAAKEYARSQSAAAQQPPQPGAPGPQPPPQPGAPASTTTAAQETPGPEGVDELVQQAVGLITTALNCLARGVDGHGCADGILLVNGDLEYRKIVSRIEAVGIPGVIALAKQVPQVSAQVQAYEAELTQFITEFIEGPEEQEEGEDAEPAIGSKGRERESTRKKPIVVA
jgi:hypothetical protein